MNRILGWLARRALRLTIRRLRLLEGQGLVLIAAVNVAVKVYSDGTTSRLCVYRVFGLTAADTISMAADFGNVLAAYFIPTTGAVAAAAAPISGNTVLTPAGALAKDDGYLVVFGAGVQQ